MLYTKNGSYPAPLPHRIVLSDGTTRTDNTSFTAEEIEDAGYVSVENPPSAEYPNKLDWDGTNWLIREPNAQEIAERWAYIKDRCLQELEDTDYKVIKAVEVGAEVEPEYVVYRQELRDLYNNVHNIDPWFVTFPYLRFSNDEELYDS